MVRMVLLVLHGLSEQMVTGIWTVKKIETWLVVLRTRKARGAMKASRVTRASQAQAHSLQHLMSTDVPNAESGYFDIYKDGKKVRTAVMLSLFQKLQTLSPLLWISKT